MEKLTTKLLNSTTVIRTKTDSGWVICGDVEIRNNKFNQILNAYVLNTQGIIKATFAYKNTVSTSHLPDTSGEVQTEINGYIKDYIEYVLQYVSDNMLEAEEVVELTEEELAALKLQELENAKSKKIDEITWYDKTENVNSFIFNGKSFWIDRETRVAVTNSTKALQAAGEETAILWLDDLSVTLSCDILLGMLSSLEVYAAKCYNVTAEHKANVNKLETKEEVEAYNYMTGYPTKLAFGSIQENTDSEE